VSAGRADPRTSASCVAAVLVGMAVAACAPNASMALSFPSSAPEGSPTAMPTVSSAATGVPSPSPAAVEDGGTWTSAGSLATPRGNHTATVLEDGRVLVAGGQRERHGVPLASAELYDPQTNTWATTGDMSIARWVHTATLLPDGRVLIAGGFDAGGNYIASAEVFDPSTGTWQRTSDMLSGHAAHTATLLTSGRVLVAGGSPGPAELYEPSTGKWTATGALPRILDSATATPLEDSTVEIVGGIGYEPDEVLASTEIYDPSTGSWANGPGLTGPREYHATARLLDGKILVTGGFDPARGTLATAELSGAGNDNGFAQTGSLLEARLGHTATTLADGRVLVAGGQRAPGEPSIASAELYDSSSQRWIQANPVTEARDGHTASLLADGRVLVIGGFGYGSTMVATAEAFEPGVRRLPASGRADEGIYATRFEPRLTIPLLSRGEVDVDSEGWLDVEFGFDAPGPHEPGAWTADVSIFRLDQVADPADPSDVSSPPPDLGAWLAGRQDVSIVAGPTPTTIGGLAATEMDVVSGESGATFGPIPDISDVAAGLSPSHRARLIAVRVGDRQVLISIGLIDDESHEHFDRAVALIEQMVDGIVWN